MSGYTQISKILNDSSFLQTDYEVLLFIQKTLYLLLSYHRDGFVHGSISNDSIEYNPVTGDVRLGSIRVKYEASSPINLSPEILNDQNANKKGQDQSLFPTYVLIPSLRPTNVGDYLVADTRNMFAVLKNIIKIHFKTTPKWLAPLIEQWDSPFGKTNGDKKPSVAALEASISYVSQLMTNNAVLSETVPEEDAINFENLDEIVEDGDSESSSSSMSADEEEVENPSPESKPGETKPVQNDAISSPSSDQKKQDTPKLVHSASNNTGVGVGDGNTGQSRQKQVDDSKGSSGDVFFTKKTTIGQLSGGFMSGSDRKFMTLAGPGIACSRNAVTFGCQGKNIFGDVSVQIGYKKIIKPGAGRATPFVAGEAVEPKGTYAHDKQEPIPPCTVRIGLVEERVLERIRMEKKRFKRDWKPTSEFSFKDANRILDGMRGIVWAPTGAVVHGILGGDLINGTVNDKQEIQIKPSADGKKIPYILNRFDKSIGNCAVRAAAAQDSGGSTDVADTVRTSDKKKENHNRAIALFPHTFLASPFGTDDILTIRDSTSSANASASIVKLIVNGKEVGVFSLKKWLETGYGGLKLEKDAKKTQPLPKFRLIIMITRDKNHAPLESGWTCSIITQSMRNCLIATHLSLYPQLGKITGVELPINQLRNTVGFGYRQQGGASVYETLPTRTPNIHTGYPYTQMMMTGSSSGNTQITPYSIVLNSFTSPGNVMPYDFCFRLLKKGGKVLLKIRSVNTAVNQDPRLNGRRRSSEREGSARGSLCYTPSQLGGDVSNALSSLDQRRHSSLSTSSRTTFVEIRTDMTIVINILNGSNVIGASGDEKAGQVEGSGRGSDVGSTSDLLLSKPTRFVCGPRRPCNLQEGDVVRLRVSSGGLWLGVNGTWLRYDKDSGDDENALPPGIKLDHSGVRAIILPMGVVLQVMTPIAPSPASKTSNALISRCQTPLVAFDPFAHTRNIEIENSSVGIRLVSASGSAHSSIAFVDVPLKVSKRTLVPNSGVCAVFRVTNFGGQSIGVKTPESVAGRYGFMVVSNDDVSQFLSEADDSDVDLTSLKIPHFAVTSDGLMSSRWMQTDENGVVLSKKSIVTSGANKRELEVGDIIALFLDVKLGGVIVLRNGIPVANSIVNGTFTGSGKVVSDPDVLLEGRTKDKIPDAFFIDSTASYRIGVFVDAEGSRESFRCELLSVFGQ